MNNSQYCNQASSNDFTGRQLPCGLDRSQRARGFDLLAHQIAHALVRRPPGIAPQSGQPAYGLGEQACGLAAEPDVPVVQRIAHWRLETQTDAADEVLRLIAVETFGSRYFAGLRAKF